MGSKKVTIIVIAAVTKNVFHFTKNYCNMRIEIQAKTRNVYSVTCGVGTGNWEQYTIKLHKFFHMS